MDRYCVKGVDGRPVGLVGKRSITSPFALFAMASIRLAMAALKSSIIAPFFEVTDTFFLNVSPSLESKSANFTQPLDNTTFEQALESSQATHEERVTAVSIASPLEKLLPLSASNITGVNIKSQFETLLPLSTINNTAVSIKVNTTGISFTVEDVVTKEETVALESWEGINRKFGYWCMMSFFIFIVSGLKKPDTTSSFDEKTCVKQEEAVEGFNLSWYEKLKYDELRRLLRERNIKIYGKKHAMVRRLVAVYNAELGTLTVVQLRKKLKSKNIKFSGRKKEIVQKLVEAGI